jgi:hypothetical protein
MHTQSRLNRILLLWLLAAVGFALSPAKSFASCDMQPAKAAASPHDCCVKKSACDCTIPSLDAGQALAQRVRVHPGCSCEIQPEPANSDSKTEPLRVFVTAAIPTRAGPDFTAASVTVPVFPALPPVPWHRFIPPSPSRAPPF